MSQVPSSYEVVMPSPRKLFTPGVTGLLIGMAAGLVFTLSDSDAAFALFALRPAGVFTGKLWQLITYSFIHDSILGFVFNGLALLMLGSTIEREWKTRSFLWLWFFVIAVCGLLWVLVQWMTGGSWSGVGAQGGIFGLIAAYGLLHRNERVMFFMAALKAQHLALLFLAIGLLLNLQPPVLLVWLAGAAVAYGYIKLIWLRQRHTSPTERPKHDRGNGFVDV